MVILDNRKNVRSFGRINSRGTLKNEKETIENILPKYAVDLDFSPEINKQNHLEIGFGYGESIFERAKNNRSYSYIGCETYIKGVLNLVNLMESDGVDNIKIFNGDARLLIENLPNESIDFIYILFPDPWPKKKHQKRRIVNEEFLDLISKKLKSKGRLFFATDIESYMSWTIEKINDFGKFEKLFNDETCKIPPSWWVQTKYQTKAIKEGRESNFLEWEIIK